METLIGKVNGNFCSIQFYDQGTGKKDGSSSAWPSSLILPEKNFHYIKISPADSDSSKFLGFTKLTPLDKDSIERDIEGLIFDDGFKRIELDPGTVFDSVGVIVRKITFPSTLEYFESIKVQDEELKRSSGAGGNGKSLLDELDFSKCKNLSFNSNFLNYWKVKKVNLYGAGNRVSPIPVFGTGSINCLGFLKLLMLPERYEVMDSSFFNIDTVSGLGVNSKSSSTEDYCTIIANTMIVNPAVLGSSKGSVFNCCNIDNFYIKSIKSILAVQANPSIFTLFRDCRIGSLYITEEIVDEFSKLSFRFSNTIVDRLYIFRAGFPKPPNWLNNFKQALGLSNLITEKFITDVTYDEAVKEIIEES